jgi:hypothetical protein
VSAEFPFPPRPVESWERDIDLEPQIPDAAPGVPPVVDLASARVIRGGNVVDGSPPTIELRAGTCFVSWGAPVYAVFEFARLNAERGGDIRAEFTARSTLPGLERRLLWQNLNLGAGRTRAELARDLAAATPGQKVPWRELLETAVPAVVERVREGEPARLLRDLVLPENAGHLMPHVLDGRVTTIHHGDGGEGKSLEMLAALVAIQSGRDDILGMAPSAQRRCGLFDWEGDGYEARQRLEQIAGVDMPEIVYVRCVGPIWDEADRLMRIIRDFKLDFAAFDSVGMACGGIPPESSEAALRFNTAFRSLEIGGLLAAHQTKDGGNEYPFGSVFWRNTARATWHVKKQQDLGANGFVLGLFNRKANTGPLATPLAFEVRFEANRIRFTRRNAADVPELAEEMPVKFRMQHALREGPMTYVEIANATGADMSAVSKAAKRGDGKTFTRIVGPDGITRVALLAHEVSA